MHLIAALLAGALIGGLFFYVVVNDFASPIIYINVIFWNW